MTSDTQQQNSETSAPQAGELDTEIQIEHPLREFLRMYFRNWSAVVGLVLFTIVVFFAVFAGVLIGVDPLEPVAAPYAPAGSENFITGGTLWLGADDGGRDLLVGILFGAKATLIVGAAAAALTVFIGITIGSISGFYGGLIDEALMRVTEFFQVLPPILLAMVLVSLFSPTLTTIAVAIGIVSWTGVARLSRAEFIRIRELEYVKAARSIGARDRRIIWKVILPNALPPLIVNAALTVGVAILFESGISFLGLGDPNVISWGKIIADNRNNLLDAPWAVTYPGMAIFITVLSISLIGDGLTDAFNPKLRER